MPTISQRQPSEPHRDPVISSYTEMVRTLCHELGFELKESEPSDAGGEETRWLRVVRPNCRGMIEIHAGNFQWIDGVHRPDGAEVEYNLRMREASDPNSLDELASLAQSALAMRTLLRIGLSGVGRQVEDTCLKDQTLLTFNIGQLFEDDHPELDHMKVVLRDVLKRVGDAMEKEFAQRRITNGST